MEEYWKEYIALEVYGCSLEYYGSKHQRRLLVYLQHEGIIEVFYHIEKGASS